MSVLSAMNESFSGRQGASGPMGRRQTIGVSSTEAADPYRTQVMVPRPMLNIVNALLPFRRQNSLVIAAIFEKFTLSDTPCRWAPVLEIDQVFTCMS
jgi:hypothetical protein